MAAAASPGSAGSIDLGLQGATIVVTGAGSGIGAAAAQLLGAAACRHFPLPEWDVAGFDEHVTTNVRAPYFLIRRRYHRFGNLRSGRWSTSVRRRARCGFRASRCTG